MEWWKVWKGRAWKGNIWQELFLLRCIVWIRKTDSLTLQKIYYRKNSLHRFLVRNGKFAQGRIKWALWEPNEPLVQITSEIDSDLSRENKS